MVWLVLLTAAAHAQGFATHHPVVPAAGIAAEGGPGALWVNPANIAYDPDFRFGLYYTQTQPSIDDADVLALPASLAATIGADGMGLGLRNLMRADDDLVRTDWSVDYVTALQLPERLSLGLLMTWNFIEADTNYFNYDAGLSWRPLPWLGLAGTAQNIGAPDPSSRAQPRTAVGLALRPFGDAVLLGGDWVRLFSPLDEGVSDSSIATLRLRPTEGLYLRGSAQADLTDTGFAFGGVEAGLEVFFGGVGGGYTATSLAGSSLAHTLMVGTDEPGESLFRTGHEVAELNLDHSPAYQPRPTLFNKPAPSWLDTLELMRHVEKDKSVKGFLLTLDRPGLSMARARELRDRVLAMERAGKPVTVYLNSSATGTSFYVASAASDVIMHPAGGLELVGMSMQLQHLRGLLDIVGVEPQFVRRGKFKSSPEGYTRAEPSEAALEQINVLLDDMYAELTAGIGEGRGVDASEVRAWIDGGPWTAEEALEHQMVDALLYPDELDKMLSSRHEHSVQRVEISNAPQPHSPWEDPKQIAIIYIEGAITSGRSSRGGLFSGRTTGADTIIQQLQTALHEPQVRAVVLRVDSPGGSAFASDEIWRAVEKLKEKGKPIVVSMGGVAASGGYYVSAGADAIWAEPTTITGSVGVYSGKFATTELFNRIGIHTTTLARGRNSTVHSSSQPWDSVQKARMQELVDATYTQFKDRVATGRGMEMQEVEEIAQGRVWSGQRAQEVGLVDNLGGLQEAIQDARRRAGLSPKAKVGLVTLGGGETWLSLAPTSLVMAPVGRLLLPAPRPTSELMLDVRSLLEPLDPLLLQATHPEGTVWLMEPWSMEITP